MSKDKPTPKPTSQPGGLVKKGYQPKPITEGYQPKPQGGHQPTTGQGAPSAPPNQDTGGKK